MIGNPGELLRASLATYVFSVFVDVLFQSINGSFPNSALFQFGVYSGIAVSAALAAGGLVGLSLGRHEAPATPPLWVSAGALLLGTFLMFASAPYPAYAVFGLDFGGFPLPFVTTSYSPFGGPHGSGSLLNLAIDLLFWISVAYPGVAYAERVLRNTLAEVGKLEVLGAAGALTLGAYPLWAYLATTPVEGLFAMVGPLSIFLVLVSPCAGAAAYVGSRGGMRHGLNLLAWSLPYMLLLALGLLAAYLRFVI